MVAGLGFLMPATLSRQGSEPQVLGSLTRDYEANCPALSPAATRPIGRREGAGGLEQCLETPPSCHAPLTLEHNIKAFILCPFIPQ